jgi:hypothetical protein
MKYRASALTVVALASAALLPADDGKAATDQKIELLRGLDAEYATAKVPLPKTKKPLEFESTGAWDKKQWDQSGRQFGPAARVGDIVQVTGVKIGKDTIELEINHGNKSGTKWYDRIQVGMGGSTRPVNQPSGPMSVNGTMLVVRFKESIGAVSSADVKKMLAPVLDFDKHSATEQYMDTLPPEIKTAITEKKPIEGMDRDQVLLALGKPLRKTRESKDGVDTEDWIYGEPPGRVMFVTFSGAKVVKVKETYAGLGGTIAETPKPPL